MLKSLYFGDEQGLPEEIQAFLKGRLEQTAVQTLPLGPALLHCLEDLHGCTLEERHRRLFLQAKATEIVCYALEALGQKARLSSTDASIVTARGVLEAQNLLKTNFAAPPSLEDLARAVGLSRSGLCAGFRQILGVTVFDYIQNLRMQHALVLLKEHNTSLAQIAYEVGYNHTSSFSVAVQRRFGVTPGELRRRRDPFAA